MKVLIVQDHRLNGGAAKAAWRLGEALHRLDYEVVHVCGDESNRTPREAIRLNGKPKKGPKRWLDALWPNPEGRRRRVIDGWEKIMDRTRPDRVWFHNLAGGFKWGWSEDLILGALERCPCLWTLHDMWALGSGRNYFPEEEADKEALLSPLRRIHGQAPMGRLKLVAPSEWLADLARRIPGADVEVFPNPLDGEIFRPLPKAMARSAMGLPDNARISLAVAENLQDSRKGMKLLLEAWRQASSGLAALLCLVGRRPADMPEIAGVRWLGSILSPSELATLYSAADLFVHPAEMENAPCVIQESLACGCPVLARPVGGIPEMLRGHPDSQAVSAGEFAKSWRDLLRRPPTNHTRNRDLPTHPEISNFSGPLARLLSSGVQENHAPGSAPLGSESADLDLRLGGEENLYHWMIYHLLQVLILEREGKGRLFRRILLSGAVRDFQGLSLHALGFPAECIERLNKAVVREKTLRVPVCPPADEGYHELYRTLRSRLLACGRGAGLGKKIYITRKDATKRHVANEDELMGALVDRGFTMVCPGELPWPEQIAAFAHADWIVGPHGAAFTNILFAPPGSRLVELFPAEENLWYFQRMAESVGVDRTAFEGEPTRYLGRGVDGFRVPLKPFLALLHHLGLE
jgi:glycosyltransferase involved in cell wall biosynthesis